MTNQELIEKLNQAQSLLSDVYHFSCENGLLDIESKMSCADDCILDTLNIILSGKHPNNA